MGKKTAMWSKGPVFSWEYPFGGFKGTPKGTPAILAPVKNRQGLSPGAQGVRKDTKANQFPRVLVQEGRSIYPKRTRGSNPKPPLQTTPRGYKKHEKRQLLDGHCAGALN